MPVVDLYRFITEPQDFMSDTRIRFGDLWRPKIDSDGIRRVFTPQRIMETRRQINRKSDHLPADFHLRRAYYGLQAFRDHHRSHCPRALIDQFMLLRSECPSCKRRHKRAAGRYVAKRRNDSN